MSRLAPAIRHRRRQLDALARAIAATGTAADRAAADAVGLEKLRRSERGRAFSLPIGHDAWFVRNGDETMRCREAEAAARDRLVTLRREAVDLHARLSALEEAEREQSAAARRELQRRSDLELDDRTGSAWHRRQP